jgi:hypothetical protein
MRSTAPLLAGAAGLGVAIGGAVRFLLLDEPVVPLLVAALARLPSGLRSHYRTASLRLRLASSLIRCCSISHAALFSAKYLQIRLCARNFTSLA